MTEMPQTYTVALGPEPVPMKAEGAVGDLGTGSASTAVAPPAQAPPATATLVTNFAYSGAHSDAEVAENAQNRARSTKTATSLSETCLPISLEPNTLGPT
jgi:hypothetical protein